MTAEPTPRIKITYATLRADNEDLHSQFEAGRDAARAGLGGYHRNYVAGDWRDGDGTFEVRSPIDTDVLVGTFAKGTPADIDDAVAAARAAQPAWDARAGRVASRSSSGRRPHQRSPDGILGAHGHRGRQEPDRGARRGRGAADLIRYYAQTAEDNEFYDHAMGNLGDTAVHTRSILRPHGVFAVVARSTSRRPSRPARPAPR